MRVHFISIGGSVMHQLAIALSKKGYHISGSDDDIFEPAKTNLLQAGLLPDQLGWYPEKIDSNIDVIILGMHAREDNPELIKAQSLGLKIYSFPEYIYQESILKKRVGIGGSHGKTSTTAMIMHVLNELKFDFDYLVGAKLAGFEHSVKITDAPVIICEADEYPASTLEKRPKFHFLYPHIAVITGIAWDHINVFPTFEFYLKQFAIYIERIEPNGVLIYNQTDSVLVELVKANPRNDIRYIPYGLPMHQIKDGVTQLQIGEEKVDLKVFGDHNLLNLHAAYLVCMELGVRPHDFLNAIRTFSGAAKRLELMAVSENTIVFRDFAHAPSKAKASIHAVRQQFPDKKLIAIFELHTYSSLNEDFFSEYKNVMDEADVAIIFYSAHALEIKRMKDIDPQKIIEGFQCSELLVMNNKKTLEEWLQQTPTENASFLFMSSGNYEGLDILKNLRLF